ncbi:hypothetical protein ACFYY8_31160 [Streptosporangium sp. NPDC001559]|uniref:hypothetical protein n=1 Tax=Streptosporangium sp. NPDC001559 TaxID=3366187 RepID=UPI0036E4A0E1
MEQVYSLKQAAELLQRTEHWLKVNARRHNWGSKLGRARVFTEAHLMEILATGTNQAAQARKPRPIKAKAPKVRMPEPVAGASVTPLRARPEAARSYGRTA